VSIPLPKVSKTKKIRLFGTKNQLQINLLILILGYYTKAAIKKSKSFIFWLQDIFLVGAVFIITGSAKCKYNGNKG